MAVKKKDKDENSIGLYFEKEKPLEFIPSGCTLLDLVLGGGFPLGRISNIIGNPSTNKTGIGIEAITNFRKKYPKGLVWYQDAEAAFDLTYAYKLGLPKDENVFIIKNRDLFKTYEIISEAIDTAKETSIPSLYVIDTLDAIVPLKEDGTLAEGYDAAKRAALINSMITNMSTPISEVSMHLMIISQTRENIGVMFGDKEKVSGGKALGFYASQRLWLKEIKKLKKTIDGVENTYGVQIEAKTKKCKVGLPFRKCEFPLIFFYGIDDVTASLEWLKGVKGGLEKIGIKKEDIKDFAHSVKYGKDKDKKSLIESTVIKLWNEIETSFLPEGGKYDK